MSFAVYRNNSASAESYPYVLDVQSELLSNLDTRLAIPLVAARSQFGKPIRNLNPTVLIGETNYIVLTQQMAAVPKKLLGEPLDHVIVDRSEVLSSIDFLITGI